MGQRIMMWMRMVWQQVVQRVVGLVVQKVVKRVVNHRMKVRIAKTAAAALARGQKNRKKKMRRRRMNGMVRLNQPFLFHRPNLSGLPQRQPSSQSSHLLQRRQPKYPPFIHWDMK